MCNLNIRITILQLGDCVKLNILSARDNQLKELPSELSKATCLRVLDVSGNRLNHLPISFATLQLKGNDDSII